jgi:hypothetical protein
LWTEFSDRKADRQEHGLLSFLDLHAHSLQFRPQLR